MNTVAVPNNQGFKEKTDAKSVDISTKDNELKKQEFEVVVKIVSVLKTFKTKKLI